MEDYNHSSGSAADNTLPDKYRSVKVEFDSTYRVDGVLFMNFVGKYGDSIVSVKKIIDSKTMFHEYSGCMQKGLQRTILELNFLLGSVDAVVVNGEPEIYISKYGLVFGDKWFLE